MNTPNRVRLFLGAVVKDRYPEMQHGRETGRMVVVLETGTIVVPFSVYHAVTRLI